MKLTPVEVEWLDSCVDSGWHAHDAAFVRAAPTQCTSVGYLIERTKAQLVLAQSVTATDDGDQIADVLTIPASVVKRVRRLR